MHRHFANLANAPRLVVLAGMLLTAAMSGAVEPAALLRDFPRTQMLLVTAQRCIMIDTWIAARQEHQAQGLMHITALGRHEGMLFIYSAPRTVAMWMKNTYLPLDMLFATADGEIVHLHHDAIPHDESIISSVEAVSLVIELNAGSIDAFGIRKGDRLMIPAG